VLPPAIPHGGINRVWDARLGAASRDPGRAHPAGKSRRIEAFLARYFAPGHCCCDAA
jgi:hypothetical protein